MRTMLLATGLAAMLATGLAVPGAAGAAEQTIAGKTYSVTPGDQPGTFVCQWGDETVTWAPKPWHHPDYREVGPAIYDRWTQGGLPYPWEMPVEERVKQTGAEIHDRSYTALYFGEFGENYITRWSIDLVSPDGTRRDKELHEWMVSYRRNQAGLAQNEIGQVRAKYMFTFIAPNDFRGLGISTTIFHGDKFNDEFLYTPAARRVRRLPQAARQDIIPGTIVRWEDFPQVKPFPDINYEVVGYTLYGGQPEGTMGFTNPPATKGEEIGIGIDGVCEPAYVLELTPKSGSYWYAKQRRIVGIKTGSSWYEEVFDSKGELIRQRVNRRSPALGDPRLQNPDDVTEDWQMIWGQEFFFQPTTGFRMDWYMNTFWLDFPAMPRQPPEGADPQDPVLAVSA